MLPCLTIQIHPKGTGFIIQRDVREARENEGLHACCRFRFLCAGYMHVYVSMQLLMCGVGISVRVCVCCMYVGMYVCRRSAG